MRFRVQIDPAYCKGCGLCIAVCEVGALKQSAQFGPRGVTPVQLDRPDQCTGCRRCALVCPDAAIQIKCESPSVKSRLKVETRGHGEPAQWSGGSS